MSRFQSVDITEVNDILPDLPEMPNIPDDILRSRKKNSH